MDSPNSVLHRVGGCFLPERDSNFLWVSRLLGVVTLWALPVKLSVSNTAFLHLAVHPLSKKVAIVLAHSDWALRGKEGLNPRSRLASKDPEPWFQPTSL